jgi:hypothetical protein
VEAEFSGTMTLYVLDLNRQAQVGVRLGFDERDTLEYHVFRGTGETLGQLAVFSPFDDKGETIPLGNRQADGRRGARPVYRPMRSNWTMTTGRWTRRSRRNRNAFAQDSAMAGNKMPPSDFLAGKALTLRLDERPGVEYRFDTSSSSAGGTRGRRSGARSATRRGSRRQAS